MSKNSNLINAKRAKNDEFYTQLKDIEEELQYYKKQLIGKVIYCNCDNPESSNFYRYFYDNYSELGLAGLIASCHSSEKNGTEKAIWAEYDGQTEAIHEFRGDGDFRSDESIELLKRADIVVTNPPFSLFREYIPQLTDYDKQFIILGTLNALTYKEIFPFFMNGKINGRGKFKGEFLRKDGSRVKLGNVIWYSTIRDDTMQRKITMTEKYTPEKYPKYDNYDAINVNKIKDIPYDYDGPMGVPITIFDNYNIGQFEIVGCSYRFGRPEGWSPSINMNSIVEGKKKYARILIKHRNKKRF